MNNNYTTHTEIIGYCGVDSGSLMIIDPCYVLKDERDMSNPLAEQSEYLRTAMPTCEAPYYAPVLLDDYGTQSMGVVFATLHGDGEYPITAEINSSGRVVRVTIDFDPDVDEVAESDLWVEECDNCGTDITDQPQHDSEQGHGTLCSSCKEAEDDEMEEDDEDQ